MTLILQNATIRDYDALSRFHYHQCRPATTDRTWRVVDTEPPYEQRATGDTRPVLAGVIVLSRPSLACAARHLAIPDRYRRQSRSEIARRLNDEVRTISRLVVEPTYRGRGLAVRLVRHAIDSCSQPVVEAIAAMGRGCPVFERAGMRRIDSPKAPVQQVVLDRFAEAGIDPALVACLPALRDRVLRLGMTKRTPLLRALAEFHRSVNRLTRSQADAAPIDSLLLTAQRRLMLRPAYFFVNRLELLKECA